MREYGKWESANMKVLPKLTAYSSSSLAFFYLFIFFYFFILLRFVLLLFGCPSLAFDLLRPAVKATRLDRLTSK